MYTERKELNVVNDSIECVFVKIVHGVSVTAVVTLYQPPKNNVIHCNDTMINILEQVGHHTCYIMGDYNLTKSLLVSFFPILSCPLSFDQLELLLIHVL